MVDYVINHMKKGFAYNSLGNMIRVGIRETTTEYFNDSELLEYISDSITHEFIHKILDDMFDNNVSKLFDTVEQHVRFNDLHDRDIKNFNDIQNDIMRYTHEQYIEITGLNIWLNQYHLDKTDVIQANIKCNTR